MADSSPRLNSTPSPPADVKSVPPRRSFGPDDDADARPARLQMLVALALGLALVALPLYLWRRPRTARADVDGTELTAAASASATAALANGVGAGAPSPGPPIAAVTLSEPRVLECHDPGPKKTAPEQCDRLAVVEQALAKAITDAASCVPASTGTSSIVYVADVSFARKKNPFLVTSPKDGRALATAGGPIASSKVAAACTAAVKRGIMAAVASLPSVPHAHTRYKVAITASYPPSAPSSPYP